MERTWIQGSVDNGSYWEMNQTPNYIVMAYEVDDQYQWAVVDSSDESVLKEGLAVTAEEAQEKASGFYDTLVVRSPWHFDKEIQAFVSDGDMPDFRCSCGNKVALAGMTTCGNCDEQWISWSVNNGEKTSKNFVRSIMKRDGVVLAATRDESPEFDDDNEIEDYTTEPAENMPSDVEDATDEDTQQILRKQKYTSLDEEFEAGYRHAEANSVLPDDFTDEFKVGFIASLQDRINDLKN